jgi:hypothetical protein
MHKERLQQMVTMLRNLPEEKRENFDLTDWNCGTSACAVGWACLDPVFIEQGLTFDRLRIAPEFMGSDGWHAVKAFFDIGFGQARDLFDIGNYGKGASTGPDEVAARIEAFIAA